MEAILDPDVLAARTGDRGAFGRLIRRYGGLVTSVSLSTVRSVSASEDVAQDVFLAAWRDLRSLRNPASFVPWLLQLTRHRALDSVRRGRGGSAAQAHDEATLAALVDPRPGTEEVLLRDERARAVATALDALPADAREVLILFYREGQSVAQVARMLGLRQDAVKKRLSRAREALREDVLAQFAEAVETTAPGEAFAGAVLGVLPAWPSAGAGVTTAWIVGKVLLKGLLKWAAFVTASASGIAGAVAGGIPIVTSIRRDLRGAVDERERRELTWIGAIALVNVAVFSLGIPILANAMPGHSRFAGTLWALSFTAVHVAVYGVWLPRAKMRRREAERLADPTASARHAREDRKMRGCASFASLSILAVIVAAWMR